VTDYPARILGALPVEAINDALGTELEPGEVHLSVRAHMHMARDHAADYPICVEHLALAIASPTYIGQAPKHGRNFEIVRRIAREDGRVILVAIGLEPNAHGAYSVKSSYLLTAEVVERRRQVGTLKVPKRPR
jgi:hypothetical protein